MPKITTQGASRGRRHNPLEDDLVATGVLKNSVGKHSKRAAKKEDGEEQAYVDAKASRKILAMSRGLIDEEEELQFAANAASRTAPSAFDFDPSRIEAEIDQDDEFDNEEAWGDEDDVVEEIEVDADDLETFNQFIRPTMNEDPLLTHGWDGKPDSAEEEGQSTNLADLILAKIAEKESSGFGTRQEIVHPVEEDYELPPKVVEVYTKYVHHTTILLLVSVS